MCPEHVRDVGLHVLELGHCSASKQEQARLASTQAALRLLRSSSISSTAMHMGKGVPACFRCPISLELMKDPVSLCTGVSYDRSSIEKWLQDGNNSCPSTLQKLDSRELIPNHTLRRLIRDWCSSNDDAHRAAAEEEDAAAAAAAAATNRARAAAALGRSEEIWRMLEEVEKALQSGGASSSSSSSSSNLLMALRRLRAKARESARNSRCIGDAGDAITVLASILSSRCIEAASREEALATLVLLPMSGSTRRMVASSKRLLSSACWLLCKGSLDARINAATLLELLATERDLKLAIGSTEGAFRGLVELLAETHNRMAVKASLRALLALCSPRRNRVKAVEAGAIAALVELLPEAAERATSENALAVLEMLCRCAEGRVAVSQHALAIPAIARKIFVVSDLATEYAVRMLWAICKHSSDEGIHQRAVEAGVFSKLLLMLQMDFTSGTKHKMGDLLKLLCSIRKHCPDVALDGGIHRIEAF